MEQYRFISVKQIMDNLTDHPMLKDLTLERVVHYALRLMKIVGCPVVFMDKIATVSYDNYRAELPCDLYKIKRIKSLKCNRKGICYRYTTDDFHLSTKEPSCDVRDLTYKVQDNYIFFSLKEDDVEIAYSAIPVDGEGYPMVVDNESFIRALESYIKYERFKIKRDMGEMDRFTFAEIEKDYFFDVAQAQNVFTLPSEDEMESITNMWTALLPRNRAHFDGFKAYSRKEILKDM